MKKKLMMLLVGFVTVYPGVGQAEDAATQQKLEQILRNQQTMLEKMEELKSEIQIVKVRTTLQN